MRPGPRLVVMVALAFISGAQSSTNQQQRESSNHNNNIIRGKLLSKRDEGARHDTSTNSFLSSINPWLSACDLAQPKQAPDLQGSCSAGTLPVAWIEEGPGPPKKQCPSSCPPKQQQEQQQHKYHVHDPNNQKNPYNDNNNINKNNNNNNIRNNDNRNNNNYYKNDINKMEKRLKENRQCLDYLGGDINDQNSPSLICKSSLSDIETKLNSLRLRHCCERDVASALHNEALEEVKKGGHNCVKRLNELIEVDELAERLTCEFTEILVRYDCGSRYSLIHHCGDCRETYRQWTCSTFLPYFARQDEIKADPDPEMPATAAATPSTTTNEMNQIASKAQNMFKQERILEGSNEIKRSRRKAHPDQKRIRIRPCLSVCQKVEQICPYMLPADRAPAYPTQYAGEPTFLCLDPNIDETGNQLYKSNHGPSECCYDYCKNDEGLCSSKCDAIFNISNSNNETAIIVDRRNNNNNNHHFNNTSKHQQQQLNESDPFVGQTPNLFVKLDNGTYILNDYSSMPSHRDMQCPATLHNVNITPSTQQCSISQAQATVTSSANSFNYYPASLISSFMLTLDDYGQLLNWTSLAWNLIKFVALRLTMLQLAIGS